MFDNLFEGEQNQQSQQEQKEQTPVATIEPPDGQDAESLYKAELAKPNNLLNHQAEMWDVINQFENRAWDASNTGIPTGWADFDNAFDGGMKTGWILIGGDSNIGKTSFLSTLAWSISQNNNDVYVMDFSLDDPMHDKIPRVVAAANKVIINAVATPQNYTQYPDMLKRRNAGMQMLYSATDRYRCYDANFSTDIDQIEEEVRKKLVDLEEEAAINGTKRKRVVVLIDNFHDLTTTASEATGSDKMKYDYLAQRVSDMATKFDIPVVTTGEFKKLNGFRRPGLDDLRESVKIKYEAKAILLVYNEVGIKGEGASIYFDRTGKPEKQPIFEVKFGKNKQGGFKGRIFFEFYPEIAYFEPVTPNDAKRFNNLIYSNN